MKHFDDTDKLFDAVARIFAVTVLLDKRQRDPELVEFVHACMTQNHALRPSTIVTRKMLLAWFRQEKPGIMAELADDHDHVYKTGLLSRVRDPELQRRVLSSIFTISVADYELHDEESEFINRALAVWKTGMPQPAELDAVA